MKYRFNLIEKDKAVLIFADTTFVGVANFCSTVDVNAEEQARSFWIETQGRGLLALSQDEKDAKDYETAISLIQQMNPNESRRWDNRFKEWPAWARRDAKLIFAALAAARQ